MTIAWVSLAGFLAVSVVGADPAPLAWSADSRWIAYRSVEQAPGAVPAPGWMLRGGAAERVRPLTLIGATGQPPVHRIYGSERDGGHLLIAEDARSLSSPCWDALRGDLLYGRASGEGGELGLELLRRGFEPLARILGALPESSATIQAGQARLVASSDGRYLAVARPWVPDVVVVRADNGRTLKTLPDATLPAWSRDGNRLAFLSGGDAPWLHVVDAGFGPSRIVVGPVAPVAPRWNRDGDHVLVVLSRKLPAPAVRGESLELVSVSVESRAAEPITKLGLNRIDPLAPSAVVSLSLDQDGDDLFYALSGIPGQPTTIVWFRPKTGETVARFHPLDIAVTVTDLTLSPDGKTLAGRYGPEGLVGLSDSGSGDLRPVVPDEGTRRAWMRLLVETARRLVHLALPPPTSGGRGVERPSVIPVPGEIARNAELATRLRRIARIGLPLCRREGNAASPASRFDEEAAFFFEFLREDWSAASRTLDAIEARATSPDERIRFLGIRAQVWMGQGDLDRAREVIAYLAEIGARTPRRLESTPAGFVLTESLDGTRGWSSYLGVRLDVLATAADSSRPMPLGHRNPDNPNDGRLVIPVEEIQGRLPFVPFRGFQR